MALKIYDFRRDQDVVNMLVTPHIRSRFLRMEPGQVANRHSHDLGHEIFLILQGRCHFEISGETAVLEPGQLCVARVDEPHQVRVVGDEPMIMYLSVTPHIQPTHTGLDGDGQRLPIRFAPSTSYDVEANGDTSMADLLDQFAQQSRQAAAALEASAEQAQALRSQLEAGGEAGQQARVAVWEQFYQAWTKAYAAADSWNSLAPRAGGED
ncbi:MAG: cupin domain-containing protein [Candidatus Latescibacteria bacterium]|nr:cupin domain-containing protein [Candidatus Latescibacterota bacterium]